MTQINIEHPDIIALDTLWLKLPKSFYVLKPIVYKDGNRFCCLFGPEPQEGIFGCGSNAEEAIWDWAGHLHELLRNPKENTEALLSIHAHIDDSEADINTNYIGEF